MSLKYLSICMLLGLAAAAGVVLSQDAGEELEDVRQAPRLVDPRAHNIGRLIPDLEFTDTEGKAGKLSDYKDKQALVILVTNKGCPICKKYAPVINEIVEAYREKNVAFLLLNPMENESVEECKDAIGRYGFTARYVPDPKGVIAKALKVNSTGDC